MQSRQTSNSKDVQQTKKGNGFCPRHTSMASHSYFTWSVPKLRTELAKRGASVGGRKTDLIERLKAFDRNRDFQPPPLESVPVPVGWPVSGNQQLQKEHRVFLPKITKEQIDQYFNCLPYGSDNQFTKDTKAVSKDNVMFKGNRVQTCSVTVKDNSIYFRGIVVAAMKNKGSQWVQKVFHQGIGLLMGPWKIRVL